MTKPAEKSDRAKLSSARLLAVQALYQTMLNGQALPAAVQEYLEHRTDIEVEEGKLARPDGALFKKILTAVHERGEDIEGLICANSKKMKREKEIEPLLKAIIMCGIAELLTQETDPPVIINDYLNVTHGFYEQAEVKLVNAVLDAVAKVLKE